jgi:hypothetical protein
MNVVEIGSAERFHFLTGVPTYCLSSISNTSRWSCANRRAAEACAKSPSLRRPQSSPTPLETK